MKPLPVIAAILLSTSVLGLVEPKSKSYKFDLGFDKTYIL